MRLAGCKGPQGLARRCVDDGSAAPMRSLSVSGEPVLLTESKALERSIRGDERETVGDGVHRDREIEVAHPVAGPLEPGLSLAKAPTHFVIPGQAVQL